MKRYYSISLNRGNLRDFYAECVSALSVSFTSHDDIYICM